MTVHTDFYRSVLNVYLNEYVDTDNISSVLSCYVTMDSVVFSHYILNRNNGTSDTSRVSTSRRGVNQHTGNLSSHTHVVIISY